MKYTKLFIGAALILTGASVYAADSSNTDQPGSGGHHHRHPEMTAAQKACFTDNGLKAPGDGERPATRPDQATMEKVHACLEKNGLTRPSGPPPNGGQGGQGGSPEDHGANN